MPMPHGPMKPETLAKRRATAAGKPWGFARWTRAQLMTAQRAGVLASKEVRALRKDWRHDI